MELKASEQPIVISSAAGKAFLGMLGVFAEVETSLRRERQMEGIARAGASDVYKGRRPSSDREKIRRLKADGLGANSNSIRTRVGGISVPATAARCA